MKNLAFMLLMIMLSLNSCSEKNQEHNSRLEDIIEDIVLDVEEEEDIVDLSEIYPFPDNSCIDCNWYFCPPFGAIWQKHICINKCEDPPVLAYEGECEQHLECNPSQYNHRTFR